MKTALFSALTTLSLSVSVANAQEKGSGSELNTLKEAVTRSAHTNTQPSTKLPEPSEISLQEAHQLLQRMKDGEVDFSSQEIQVLEDAHAAIVKEAKKYPHDDLAMWAPHVGIVAMILAFLGSVLKFGSSKREKESKMTRTEKFGIASFAAAALAVIGYAGMLWIGGSHAKKQYIAAQDALNEHDLSEMQQRVFSDSMFWWGVEHGSLEDFQKKYRRKMLENLQ